MTAALVVVFVVFTLGMTLAFAVVVVALLRSGRLRLTRAERRDDAPPDQPA